MICLTSNLWMQTFLFEYLDFPFQLLWLWNMTLWPGWASSDRLKVIPQGKPMSASLSKALFKGSSYSKADSRSDLSNKSISSSSKIQSDKKRFFTSLYVRLIVSFFYIFSTFLHGTVCPNASLFCECLLISMCNCTFMCTSVYVCEHLSTSVFCIGLCADFKVFVGLCTSVHSLTRLCTFVYVCE